MGMQWYECTGKPYRIRQVQKSVSKQQLQMVQANDTSILVRIGDDHIKWLHDVTKDFDVRLKSASEPEYVVTSACGRKFSSSESLKYHARACRVCTPLKSDEQKHGLVNTIKIPGADTSDVEGLISAIRKRAEEAMTLAATLEQVSKSLSELQVIDIRLNTIKQEAEEYRKAIKHFLQDKL